MKQNATSLVRIGEALYGPRWITSLSEELSKGHQQPTTLERRLQRCMAGTAEWPDWLWPQLGALCRRRGAALDKLATALLAE